MSTYTLRLLGGPCDGDVLVVPYPARHWIASAPGGRAVRYVIDPDAWDAPSGPGVFEAAGVFDRYLDAVDFGGANALEPVASGGNVTTLPTARRRGTVHGGRWASTIAGALVGVFTIAILIVWHYAGALIVDTIGWDGALIGALLIGGVAGAIAHKHKVDL